MKKRVVIIDDSVFMRTMLKLALDRCPDIEVAGMAENGAAGLEMIRKLRPDAVTLDIEMPEMDGLTVLERLGKSQPVPVVVVSTKTQAGADHTIKAMERGAVTCVAKPIGQTGASLSSFQQQVVKAIKTALASHTGALDTTGPVRKLEASSRATDAIVAIGISAGGPATLHKMLPALPAGFPPTLLTQHMPASFVPPFVRRLDEICNMNVKLAEQNDRLETGRILVAPGTHHLRIERVGGTLRVRLDDGPKVSGFRPSVDALLESLAKCAGHRVVAIVMTGMGFDGARGIKLLKQSGAATFAQDEASSVVYGMPKAAAATGAVDRIVGLADIPKALQQASNKMAQAGTAR